MTRNQTQRLLDLLRSQGEEGITALDALEIVGSFRCAARIFQLREAGEDIETRWEALKGKRYARYVWHSAMRLWP
jgi:hypothetical protein